jgi:hypothetical protein
MRRNYRLQAEPGRYELLWSPARGILGATYTGRSIDVEGGYPEAKKWLENYETSHGEHPELEHQLLQSLGLAAAHTFEAPLFRGRFFSSPPDSFQDFGPPPPDRARRGRYNTEGGSCSLPLLSRKRLGKRTREATARMQTLDTTIPALT